MLAVYIYNNALSAQGNDPLKAAHALVDTMSKFPDTRSDDMIEAVAALLREALAKRGR